MSRVVLLLLLAVAFAPPAALAHSHKKRGVEVVHPWTHATSSKGEAATAQVFMKIKNLSGEAERLIGASTPLATKAELQEGDGESGKVAGGVAIPPGKAAEFTRDGVHLVLTGVSKKLEAYDSFKLTLVFERTGRMVVDVAIEEAETQEPRTH